MIPIDECLQGMMDTEKRMRILYLEILESKLNDNPAVFDRDNRNIFFKNIESLGDWEEPEFGLVKEISLGIKNYWGFMFFPIQKWFDGRNKSCLRILMYLIPFLEQEEKEEYATYFIDELVMQDALNSDLFNEIIDTLVNINGDKVLDRVVTLINTEIEWNIIGPLKILLEIGDLSHIDLLIEILDKVDKDYYKTHSTNVRTLIVDFFNIYPDKKCIMPLLNLLNKIPGYDKIPKTLAKIGASALQPIVNAMKETTDFSMFAYLVQAVEYMDNSNIKQVNFKEIYDIAYKEYVIWEEHRLINISSKLDDNVIPLLEELINSTESREYLFARKCLEKRGISISHYLNENILLKLYDYFYLQIDERRDKRTLQNGLTDQKLGRRRTDFNVFEQSVQTIFSSNGFEIFWVEPVKNSGLDFVAFSNETNNIILIACTEKPGESDILNISKRYNELESLFQKYHLIPLICVNDNLKNIIYKDMAYSNNIYILANLDMIEILQLSRDNRPHKEIMEYIKKLKMRHISMR